MSLISGFLPPGFSSGSPSGRRHAASGTTSPAKLNVTRNRTDGTSQTNRCFTADLQGGNFILSQLKRFSRPNANNKSPKRQEFVFAVVKRRFGSGASPVCQSR